MQTFSRSNEMTLKSLFKGWRWTPAAGFGVVLSCLGLVAACALGVTPTSTADCASSNASALSVLNASPAGRAPSARQKRAAAFGKAHNDGVKDFMRRLSRVLPDTATFEQVSDALVTASRDYAQANGLNPDSLAVQAKVEVIATVGDRVPGPRVAAYLASLHKDPEVEKRVRKRHEDLAVIHDRVFKHSHAGHQGASLAMTVSDSEQFLSASGDMIATSTDSTVLAPAAISNTDAAAGYWVGQIVDSAWSDATVGVQELADSSRALWEDVVFQSWVDSGGDSTIFHTELSVARSNPGADCVIPGGGPRPAFYACPWCVPAAVGAVGADALAIVSNYDNKVAHPVASVIVSSAIGAVAGWAVTEGALAGAATKLGNFVKNIFWW
jgi:hypothetical protein